MNSEEKFAMMLTKVFEGRVGEFIFRPSQFGDVFSSRLVFDFVSSRCYLALSDEEKTKTIHNLFLRYQGVRDWARECFCEGEVGEKKLAGQLYVSYDRRVRKRA